MKNNLENYSIYNSNNNSRYSFKMCKAFRILNNFKKKVIINSRVNLTRMNNLKMHHNMKIKKRVLQPNPVPILNTNISNK